MTTAFCSKFARFARPAALALSVTLLAPSMPEAAEDAATAGEAVSFEWFEYSGHDRVFELSKPARSFRNPILAGFYPDPAVTRVGDTFYLVNSTFTYYPGIPVFESKDLVHWKQVGNVIERPSQLDFDGIGLSKGVFAPDIEFHDGTFYVLNTAVDSGGTFLSTAKSAAGPWSDPVWFKDVEGIDPSLFIDDDGKAYVLNNGMPIGTPRYDGHRAIWMQEFQLDSRKLIGPRRVLVDGGVEPAKNPIWIEGPHLYKRNGWYYLMCAEGGTSVEHSEVVFRSRSPWGPYTPYAGNPILTQRDLPADRPNPVINAGHADLVEAPDGSWWAVFLGSRAYQRTHYNTGRETFLLPVTWKDEWPVILPQGQPIPYVLPGPKFMTSQRTQEPYSGNFVWRDEFDQPTLRPEWLHIRVPKDAWADLKSKPGALTIHPRRAPLELLTNPSFLGRRLQHTAFGASTELSIPTSERVSAGLVVFQSEGSWFYIGARRAADGARVFLQRRRGTSFDMLATAPIPATGRVRLQMRGDGAIFSFFYSTARSGWTPLRENEDGTHLSTDLAGGFVGATVGPFARLER
jgi:alpha-N-arabinofuranosidase